MENNCKKCGCCPNLCFCIKTNEQIYFRMGMFREWLLNELDRASLDFSGEEFVRGQKETLCDVIDAFDKKFESLQ